MLTIPGRIVRGFGAASQTIELQMPHFVESHPELGRCSRRTINVILECQLEIVSPSFVIGPIQWHANARPEMFGFRSIILGLDHLQIESEAWIYLPYNSPHRTNPFHVEVLAPELKLKDSTACKLFLNAGKVLA